MLGVAGAGADARAADTPTDAATADADTADTRAADGCSDAGTANARAADGRSDAPANTGAHVRVSPARMQA